MSNPTQNNTHQSRRNLNQFFDARTQKASSQQRQQQPMPKAIIRKVKGPKKVQLIEEDKHAPIEYCVVQNGKGLFYSQQSIRKQIHSSRQEFKGRQQFSLVDLHNKKPKIGSKRMETITGKNIQKVEIDKFIQEVNSETLTFEGMPRMIFDNEVRGQKINWIRLVNNMLSFSKQTNATVQRRNTIKIEKEQLGQLAKLKDYQKQLNQVSPGKRSSFLTSLKDENQIALSVNQSSSSSSRSSRSRQKRNPYYDGSQVGMTDNKQDSLVSDDSFMMGGLPKIIIEEAEESNLSYEIKLDEQFLGGLKPFKKREGVDSMIELEDEDQQFNFQALSYNGLLRRKSCACSRCLGCHQKLRRGLMIVLDTDYPHCNKPGQDLQRKRTFNSQLIPSNKIPSPDKRMLPKTKSTVYANSNLVGITPHNLNSKQVKAESIFTFHKRTTNKGTHGDSEHGQIMPDEIAQFQINSEETYEAKSKVNDKQLSDSIMHSSFHSQQKVKSVFEESSNSSENHQRRDVLSASPRRVAKKDPLTILDVQANIKRELGVQNTSIKVPVPLFKARYYRPSDCQTLQAQEDSIKLVKLPSIVSDILKQKLSLKPSCYTTQSAYLKKLLQSRSSKDLEFAHPHMTFKPKSLIKQTNNIYKTKPVTIPEKVQLTTLISPKHTASMPFLQNTGSSSNVVKTTSSLKRRASPAADSAYFTSGKPKASRKAQKEELKVDTNSTQSLYKGYSYMPSSPQFQSYSQARLLAKI